MPIEIGCQGYLGVSENLFDRVQRAALREQQRSASDRIAIGGKGMNRRLEAVLGISENRIAPCSLPSALIR